jgi:hypothetical protein
VGSVSAWEAIFMLLVLKIPVVYLAAVVWWAIRAEPDPGDGPEPEHVPAPLEPCGWDGWRRRRSLVRAARRPLPARRRLRPRTPAGAGA